MMTKFTALLVGVAMFGGTGPAHASEAAKPTKAEEVSPILASVTGIIQHQDTQLVMLTDAQMDMVASAHLSRAPSNNKEHSGYYWDWRWLPLPPGYHLAKGKHDGCGDVSCGVARAALMGGVGATAGLILGGPLGAAVGGAAGIINSRL